MTQWKVEARLSFEEVYGNSENYHDVMMLLRRKLHERILQESKNNSFKNVPIIVDVLIREKGR